MEREISDRNILDKFCEDFCAIVEKHCKYIVVSGFQAIASGRTRGTEDIDLIMEKIDERRWKDLFQDLGKNNFVCMQTSSAAEAYEYLRDNTSIRFTRHGALLPEMEVKFAKDLLDNLQIKSRVKLPLTGLNVWFGEVNINIAFKEELLKSTKDLEDARHLRIVYEELINEEEIKNFKTLIKKYRL